jgi:cytochrome c55X
MNRTVKRILALTAAASIALACAPQVQSPSGSSPDHLRQGELTRLVLQDCGSCHGMRLTGGLGPPLTPQALAGKPRESMIATIVQGRHGTPMPPWAAFLTEAEAAWIVDRLQEGNLDAR